MNVPGKPKKTRKPGSSSTLKKKSKSTPTGTLSSSSSLSSSISSKPSKKKSIKKSDSHSSVGSSQKRRKKMATAPKKSKSSFCSRGVDSIDDDVDNNNNNMFQLVMTNNGNSNTVSVVPTPSLPLHELPDPNEMIQTLNKEMKMLKVEAKRLLDELETVKRGEEAAAKEILEIKRKEQLDKLRGNELIKIDHLLRLGFDEVVIKEHLELVNKDLRQETKKKQKDVNNLGINVQKMVTMNKESEKAVTAAHGAYRPLIVTQQTLQAKLEQAEVELYALQTKVEHRRNMKSVEFACTDRFKSTLKDVVRKLQIRCRDQELLRDVLKQAGKRLKTDLSLSPVERERLSVEMDGSKDSVSLSPKELSKLDSPQNVTDEDDSCASEQVNDDLSESISVQTYGSSTVDVSSVEDG